MRRRMAGVLELTPQWSGKLKADRIPARELGISGLCGKGDENLENQAITQDWGQGQGYVRG